MEGRALQIERHLRDPVVGDGILAPPYEGIVCENIRAALRLLGFRIPSGKSYDAELKNKVLEFQKAYNHTNQDGLFGPGTRRLLAQILDQKAGTQALSVLEELNRKVAPLVFLSYAWADSPTVDKIDQWLRDKGVRIQRDTRDFKPGQQLPDAIKDAIVRADKVLAVYSSNSKERDWPRFEISVAEQKEQSTGKGDLIVYLVLDDTPLPKHDPNRIAVFGHGRTVRQVGQELLRGILGEGGETPRIEFDENELL
ncbi:MAG: toll/interleukin-1 receptor domain-containing protein [Chloroflexi bacterium]|nr:toll/interleukin-1 receptor domain-containing protein [Chloroflexota bacterium]